MNLDKSVSRDIQDITVIQKERPYLDNSKKIRIISGFSVKIKEIRTLLKNQE
jgi:hypothetical protein